MYVVMGHEHLMYVGDGTWASSVGDETLTSSVGDGT